MEISAVNNNITSNPTKLYENKYDEHFALAGDDSTMEAYWAEQAKKLDWYKAPDTTLDQSNAPFYTWFNGGILNTCYNCIDRHAKKAPSRKALVYENSFSLPNVPSVEYTYAELLDNVSRLAGVFRKYGIQKGDVVMIYMPNIPEAVFSIFACTRIGALHYAVFDCVGGDNLVSLINDTQPKFFVVSSCSLPNKKIVDRKVVLDDALRASTLTRGKKLVVQREIHKVQLIEGEDLDFYEELSQAEHTEAVPLSSTDPLFITNTSGTTGKPKGLVFYNGSYSVGSYYNISKTLDIKEGDVLLSNSDIFWGCGLMFNVYGSLIAGGTSVFFEGSFDDIPGLAWKLCEKHKVKSFVTYPYSVRAMKKEDPEADYIKKADLSNLKTFVYAGEKMDITTYKWLTDSLPSTCAAFDLYGQTESGLSLSSNLRALHVFPHRHGSCYKPMPGMRMAILDEDNQPQVPNRPGKICIKLPMPPGFAASLYTNERAFNERYLSRCPGYYVTGDMGFFDKDGYLYLTGREDDNINVCASLISVIQIEEILCTHPDVAEAGVAPAFDGSSDIPVGFIILKKGVTRDIKEIEAECKEKVDLGIGYDMTACLTVNELPKTKSGKTLRRILKSLLQAEDPLIPGSCRNPEVVTSLRSKVREYGFGRKHEMSFFDQ